VSNTAATAPYRLRRRKNPGNLYPNKYLYPYLLPALLVLLLLGMAPFIYNIIMSFTDRYLASTEDPNFIGFANYAGNLTDPAFWDAAKVTLIYVLITVAIEFALGLFLAIIFQLNFHGKKIIRSVILIPMIAAPIAISFMWRIILNPNMGVLNYLLGFVGVDDVLWTGDPKMALFTIIMVDVWQWTPFVFIIMSSGIAALPSNPFEACLIDGGSFWQAFRYVMLPLLRPIILITLIFRLVDSIKAFDTIFIITAGGPGTATETLNLQTYLTAFKYFRVGYAAALSIIVLLIIIVVTNVLAKKADLNFDN
jgi:multiple sugar transport system permease protein